MSAVSGPRTLPQRERQQFPRNTEVPLPAGEYASWSRQSERPPWETHFPLDPFPRPAACPEALPGPLLRPGAGATLGRGGPRGAGSRCRTKASAVLTASEKRHCRSGMRSAARDTAVTSVTHGCDWTSCFPIKEIRGRAGLGRRGGSLQGQRLHTPAAPGSAVPEMPPQGRPHKGLPAAAARGSGLPSKWAEASGAQAARSAPVGVEMPPPPRQHTHLLRPPSCRGSSRLPEDAGGSQPPEFRQLWESCLGTGRPDPPPSQGPAAA